MKIKTQDLTDAALDWAVAISKGIPAEELYIQKWGSRLAPSIYRRNRDADGNLDGTHTSGPDLLFSRKWEAGGPIIEREGIGIRQYGDFLESRWQADKWAFKFVDPMATGPTPLIAAMRCLCSAKLGDEVEIPDELLL